MSEQAVAVLRSIDRAVVRMADLRPDHADSLPGVDRIGRKQGHWFGGLTYANLCAEVGVKCNEVPGEYWSLSITDDGFPAAEVACPCRETPLIEALAPMVLCGCGRAYFFDGDHVWAFNPPRRIVPYAFC